MRTSRGPLLALGCLLTVVVAAPPPAEAAVVICSKKGKLTLRTDACKRKETVVDAAELGVTGPKGDTGDTGAAGAPGLSGVEVVTTQETFITTGTVDGSATASCPTGKKVIGGGGEVVPVVASPTGVQVRASVPVVSDPQGWTHEVTVTVNDDWGVRAYAICATAD